MTTNVGTIDRILRAGFGLALVFLAFFSGHRLFSAAFFKVGAAAIGVVLLFVAAIGVCPIYSMFGIRTCRT